MKGHPIFAAFYDRMQRRAEATFLGPLRRELLAGVHGTILDVGAGSGANFPYFPTDAQVVALEPDPYMRRRGERRPCPAPVQWVAAGAEAIPFPDNHFDVVVATLVLCSVSDPQRSLAEIRRVLKPSGKLIFLEHVVSDQRGPRRVQTLLNPLWRKLAAGCHLTRDSLAALQASGFAIAWFKRVTPMAIQPVVYGHAKKGA